MDEYDCRAPALDVVVEVGSRNREPTLSVHVRIVVEPGLFAGVDQALPRVISQTRSITTTHASSPTMGEIESSLTRSSRE